MKKNLMLLFVAVLVAALGLAACGGGDTSGGGGEESAIGNASAGEELFAEQIIGSQAGCSTCHSLEPDVVIVGPSMAGIAARAGSTVAGLSAEDYLRQSILEPDAYVVEGFTPGVMVQVWAEELTEEQVDNLIAYLLTLN